MIPIPAIVWKALAALAVFVAAAGSSAWLMHSHDEKTFQAYKTQQAAIAEKAAADSAAKARAAEQAQAAAQAAAAQQAAIERTENANRTNATIAALRAGTLQLSNQLASTRATVVSQATAAGTGTADASAARLPDDTAQFLVDEASRADQLAIQYNEALKVIAQDRMTCNGAAP